MFTEFISILESESQIRQETNQFKRLKLEAERSQKIRKNSSIKFGENETKLDFYYSTSPLSKIKNENFIEKNPIKIN